MSGQPHQFLWGLVFTRETLSVIIFLTVMNTLSDSLHNRSDLGYTLPSSFICVNDDACVVSSTPADCQCLLDLVQRWLEWAKLKAKVPKCRSMVIQASTGRRVNPGLSMVGEDIPPVENDNFKFLGMPVCFYKDNNAARMFLKQMLVSIEEVPLTRQQKLCMGRPGQIIEHLYIFPPSEERWVGPSFSCEPVQETAVCPHGETIQF